MIRLRRAGEADAEALGIVHVRAWQGRRHGAGRGAGRSGRQQRAACGGLGWHGPRPCSLPNRRTALSASARVERADLAGEGQRSVLRRRGVGRILMAAMARDLLAGGLASASRPMNRRAASIPRSAAGRSPGANSSVTASARSASPVGGTISRSCCDRGQVFTDFACSSCRRRLSISARSVAISWICPGACPGPRSARPDSPLSVPR